jgi:hypothetical protein
MKELTKEQLLALLQEKDTELESLRSRSGKSMPQRVLELIESGYYTIDELGDELKITNKNVSSNLTYIRRELRKQGKWLISSTIDSRTYLKVMTFEELGWNIK